MGPGSGRAVWPGGGGLLGRDVAAHRRRPLSRLGAAVLLRRPDQGLPRPRQPDASHTASTISDESKSRPISSTRLPRWSPSSIWANIPSTRSASESNAWSIWDTPSEREQKKELAREKILERLIGRARRGRLVAGVDPSAPHLGLAAHRPRSQRRSSTSRPRETVNCPIKPSSRSPRSWSATSPTDSGFDHRRWTAAATSISTPATRRSATARATGLAKRSSSEEILEKLDWIKGVRVQVQVISPTAAEVASEPGQCRCQTGRRPDRSSAGQPSNAAPRSDSGGPTPAIGVNQAAGAGA